MTILHIANSYGGTDVYTNLYTSIDNQRDTIQLIYIPLNANNHDRYGKKIIQFKNNNSNIHYSKRLKRYHKYLYQCKINTVVKDIGNKYDLSSVNIIHAHTLCFDGAIAYELSKKFHIPYIVAIRNTDIDTYYKKLPWKRKYFTKILMNAERIIFISPKYQERFLHTYISKSEFEKISRKVQTIPNGINSIFLENRVITKKTISTDIKVIYTGAFVKRKALKETIEAVTILNKKGYNISLTAIGKGLPFRATDEDYIKEIERISEGKQYIKLEEFKPLNELLSKLRNSDIFIMDSSHETFGLVYVEALSQGLPIIYAKNEGFDGFYPNGEVGFSAEPCNTNSIVEALENVIDNYDLLSDNISRLNLNHDFDWMSIGKRYLEIYNTIFSNK